MKRGQRVTLDAHTLIWYYHEESNIMLSQRALVTIMEAEEDGIIYVPTIVLMEVMRVLEKRTYPVSFDDILQDVEDNPACSIVPLTTEVVRAMRSLPGLELHDRAIVATASITDSVLVSKDKNIKATGLNVIWSKRE